MSKEDDDCYYAPPTFSQARRYNPTPGGRIYKERLSDAPAYYEGYFDAPHVKRRSLFYKTEDESSSTIVPCGTTKAPVINQARGRYADNTDDCGISDAFRNLKIEDKVEPVFCSKIEVLNENRNIGDVAQPDIRSPGNSNIATAHTEKAQYPVVPSLKNSMRLVEDMIEEAKLAFHQKGVDEEQHTRLLGEEAVIKDEDKEGETLGESADSDAGTHSFISINLEGEGEDVEDEGWVRI
jgi:hypothetical protein